MFSSTLKLKFNPISDTKIRSSSYGDFPASIKCSHNNSQDLIEKVRERVKGKVEISPSAYDTAWVAMVPAREYSGRKPHFPECLDWIVENQNADGSWGVQSPSLLKHSLSSTLACLLPLRKWRVSDNLIHKGLDFIRSSASAATDKDQITPIGFDIVFPTMIQYANDLDLEVSLDRDLVDILFRNREAELRRNRNLKYFAEGVGSSMDWEKILMHQRSNGSLFDSPATTAAALIHRHDDRCMEYLNSLLREYKTWVPTIHPVDVYARLCLVDHLQDLGVERFFETEIETILQETFRLWQLKNEEIFTNAACLAMAFRLLRLQGFHVTPDELAAYIDPENFFASLSFETSVTDAVLDLYKASHVRLPDDDGTLETLHDWTFDFLKQQLLTKTILDEKLERKVEFNLMNHHGMLDAVKFRQNIDFYDVDHFWISKTAYRCATVYNEETLQLSAQNFMATQAVTQREIHLLERWYDDSRLDMEFGRNVTRVAHFLSASLYTDPQLSEARLAFAKTTILVTRYDDFFDHHGSREESLLLIELIRQWKEPSTITFSSKEVENLYSALYADLTYFAEKAYPVQGRCIKSLLIFLWVELLTCFMSEMESCTAETPPDFDEYLAFAKISVACRICVLISIHLANIEIPEERVLSAECDEICDHACSISRLLNDLQTFKKEQQERKTNSVSILMNSEKMSEEEAVSKIRKIVDNHRRKLRGLVLEREGSIFHRSIMNVFWRSCLISYYLYTFTDEFSSPQYMKQDMKLLFHDPLFETSPSLVC